MWFLLKNGLRKNARVEGMKRWDIRVLPTSGEISTAIAEDHALRYGGRMTNRHKVLVNRRVMDRRQAFYGALTPPAFELVCVEDFEDTAHVAAVLKDVEFSFGVVPSEEWLEQTPNLRFIQLGGVGYVEAGIRAAKDRGIPVALTPEGTCLGVAEHTILLILALYKHLIQAHQALRDGKWIHNALRGISHFLYGKVLGVVGLGRIGTEVVHRTRGFLPERIVYTDLFRKTPEQEADLGVEYLALDDLLRMSDIVTLHVFLSDASRGMIGQRELALMKPSAILINTSRGAVVDEHALYHALRDGVIWGAGLDAWNEEPTAPDNPILKLDNVVCTPHMATGTIDADRMKFEAAIANFQRVLEGKEPLNVIERLYSEMGS